MRASRRRCWPRCQIRRLLPIHDEWFCQRAEAEYSLDPFCRSPLSVADCVDLLVERLLPAANPKAGPRPDHPIGRHSLGGTPGLERSDTLRAATFSGLLGQSVAKGALASRPLVRLDGGTSMAADAGSRTSADHFSGIAR